MMAKRTIVVDDADLKAAEQRLEAELKTAVDEELARRAPKETKPTMDAADKNRLEAAEKAAEKATTDLAAATKRLEALESCAGTKRTEDDAETLRRATHYAKARFPAARVEAEAKRVAAMGRASVDELLDATPAPRADPLRLGMRQEAAPAAKPHYERRLEETPDGTTQPAFTVTDWSRFGPAPKGGA